MNLVREFHEAFSLAAPPHPPLRADPDLVRLRMRLIREEYEEVMAELALLVLSDDPNHAVMVFRNLLKELCDLRYVTEGAAVAFGLDIDAAYSEVHRSNMSKLGADGAPIYREDGKVVKGPNYSEADMTPFIPDILEVT
jgi:predicted HAD superfamily Cof-like phosphohydrolase